MRVWSYEEWLKVTIISKFCCFNNLALSFSFPGGLISDLQRLLPLDSGSDLYLVKYPDVPASLLYYVRPFQPADEEAVYSLAADAYERTIDAPMGKFCWSNRIYNIT